MKNNILNLIGLVGIFSCFYYAFNDDEEYVFGIVGLICLVIFFWGLIQMVRKRMSDVKEQNNQVEVKKIDNLTKQRGFVAIVHILSFFLGSIYFIGFLMGTIDVNNLLHLNSIIDTLRKVENVSVVSRLFIN